VLIDFFVTIESYFKRLESYTEVPPTAEMTNMMVKITSEVLSIVAAATDGIRHGGSSELIDIQKFPLSYSTFLEKYLEKLMRIRTNEWRSSLSKFTMELVQMAIVETSKVTK
jgi:hypothetical protein